MGGTTEECSDSAIGEEVTPGSVGCATEECSDKAIGEEYTEGRVGCITVVYFDKAIGAGGITDGEVVYAVGVASASWLFSVWTISPGGRELLVLFGPDVTIGAYPVMVVGPKFLYSGEVPVAGYVAGTASVRGVSR